MAKVIVTFKLEEEIYSRLRDIAKEEGRGVSEILREALTDWLQKKKYVSVPDFITFIKGKKSIGRSWTTERVNNLLKLRTLWNNKVDWDAFWSRQPSCGVSFSPN